jgi:hypothetical protein
VPFWSQPRLLVLSAAYIQIGLAQANAALKVTGTDRVMLFR